MLKKINRNTKFPGCAGRRYSAGLCTCAESRCGSRHVLNDGTAVGTWVLTGADAFGCLSDRLTGLRRSSAALEALRTASVQFMVASAPLPLPLTAHHTAVAVVFDRTPTWRTDHRRTGLLVTHADGA